MGQLIAQFHDIIQRNALEHAQLGAGMPGPDIQQAALGKHRHQLAEAELRIALDAAANGRFRLQQRGAVFHGKLRHRLAVDLFQYLLQHGTAFLDHGIVISHFQKMADFLQLALPDKLFHR